MIGEIIFEKVEDKIIITKHNSAIPEAYELIENLVWGSNGPRFYKINTQVKIDNSVNPDFLYLWKNGDFAGMCTISHRKVWLGSEWLPSYYLQFFSMNPKFQGQGLGNILVESVRDHYQNISSHKVVSYAYIEGENVRSDKVAHFIKYKQAAKFKTILFGRMFPKKNANCRQCNMEEKEKVFSLMESYYKDYSFAHFEYILLGNDYWVLEKDGEILAGIQVHPQHWKFVSIPGVSGKFIHKVLPFVPIANRLFNAKNHKFLCFEGHYCKPGHERDLLDLMEHCLAHFNRTSGLMWFDVRSPLFKKLDALNHFGLIDKIQGKHSAHVYAKLHNIPDEKWAEYTDKPFYIAAYDCV